MPTAKVRSLQVRPIQSADLAFETAGVLSRQNTTKALLGNRVRGADFSTLIADLGRTAAEKPERLVYDARKITEYIEQNYDYLFSTRNEMLAAGLQQALAHREISYLERFLHKNSLVSDLNEAYAAGETGKVNRLIKIQQLTRERKEMLNAAYERTLGTGVITDTRTSTTNTGTTIAETSLLPMATRNTRIDTHLPGGQHQWTEQTQAIPQAWRNGNFTDLVRHEGPDVLSQQTKTTHDLRHTSETRNAEYRSPSLDNFIEEHKSQVGLHDEIVAQKAFSYRVPHLGKIIDRELEILDLDVRKAQISFASTFLLSPISGIITAVYKDLGESVNAGEPVVRVENDERLLITGIIQYRGMVKADRTRQVQIRADNVYETAAPLVIPGTIVSVRGHDSDDDEWDVIIECANPERKLPINYHFDRESTRIEI